MRVNPINSLHYWFAEEFDNYLQQDAHEFLNFLINRINEILLGERRKKHAF